VVPIFRQIARSSLQFPLLVAGLVVGLLALGATQLREMPVDALPDFSPVYVEVQTESLGLSAVEVEQLITAPMEQILLNGVPWLDDITSESIPGLSSIVLFFEPGTDPLEARQVVQERLAQGRDLPKVARAPVMLQPLSSTSRVAMVRIDSDELTPIEQSVLAKWTIKPALMGVPGVANVAIWGQREQQMQVHVDSERLAARGVSLNQVVTTSANSLWVSPLSFVEASTPGTGGFVDTPNQRLGIHHVLPITEPDDLGAVALEGPDGEPVLGDDGQPVRLGDVVTVVEDHQPLIGDAVAEDRQGLLLVVEKFPEANALEVTEGVEETMAELAPGLDGITYRTDVYRPATYLDLGLRNAGWALAGGFLLVLLTLLVLHGWRSAVIAAVTVPLSLVSGALVLQWAGATMNLMLWAGLMTAAAAVVDDAVTGYESLRTAATPPLEHQGHRREAGATATARVRRPLAFATLVMLAATVPLLFLGFRNGLDAAFIRPIVLGYTLALVASMMVALVVSPTLAMLLLPRRGAGIGVPRLAERLGIVHSRLLGRGLARPTPVLAGVGALALLGLVVSPTLDVDMKPAPAERTFLVHWTTAPGTSHPEMSRITSLVADEIRSVPGIEHVGAHIGRALASDQVANVNSGELWASLTDGADYDDTLSALRSVVSGYPGVEQEVLTYTDERNAARGVGTTTSEDLVVRLYGQEYDVLADRAEDVRRTLEGIEGAGSVVIRSQQSEAQIEVKVNLGAARQAGVTPGEVRRAAATLVAGIEVGSLFEQQKVFEVVVIGSPEARHDMDVVENLSIATADGGSVRLGDVAAVDVVPVPTSIRHDSVSRYVDVVADVTAGDAGAVAEEAEEALAAIDFPLEYHAEILTDYAEEQAGMTRALGYALGALALMVLLLQAYLRSWRLAGVIFLCLPLALSGALLTAVIAGFSLDIGVLLGLLLLTGVYVRATLLLHARYQELGIRAGHRPETATVIRGAQDRFVPVIVTLVAVAGLALPAVVMGRDPGLELLQPMAAVTLGGLVTTALMVLLAVPLLYHRTAPDLDDTRFTDPTPAEDQPLVGAR